MPVQYFHHYHHECSNLGVNLDIGTHSQRLRDEIKAGWIKTILDWDHTRSLNWDGEYHQGRGDTWVRTGGMEDVVVKPIKDHAWQDKWPSNKRHREIVYHLDYNIRIATLPVEDKGEGAQHTYVVGQTMLHTSGG